MRLAPSSSPDLDQATFLESTLEAVAMAVGYQRWLAATVSPFLLEPVLEIGAGLGGFTRALAERTQRLLVSEPDPRLQARLRLLDGVEVVQPLLLPITDHRDLDGIPARTIILSNVIEHIEDDTVALASLRSLVSLDRLALITPAHPWAYSPVDSALGHHRRYTASLLRERVEAAGWQVLHLRHFNPIGALAWAASGRLLGRSAITSRHTRAVEVLLPLLRAADHLARGRWLGQSLICVAERKGPGRDPRLGSPKHFGPSR